MTKDELSIAVYWAAKEGWNPGLYDSEAFFVTDPKGFYVGLLDGKPIGVISAVSYGDYGFLGLYIVKPEYRGKGYGMKLTNKALNYLKGKNIGADGVIENLKIYERINLKLKHYNARYQGAGTGIKKLNKNIVNLSKYSFEKLSSYDTKVFGFKRTRFLKAWINQPETIAFGLIAKERLRGYGVIRKCYTGYKIAPIFADSKEIAETLFQSLRGQVCDNNKVFLDIPEVNKEAVSIINKYKMKKVFSTGRIYTKGQPNFPLEKWFGITSFELG
jgi:GNAT superfamily N-acetyltransferase